MQTRLAGGIAALQQATTLEELRAAVSGLRDQYEVEHFVYHSVNSTGQQYAVLTYAADWVDRYIEQDYARIDPVVQGCFRRFHPVDWKLLDWSGRPARAFLSEAIDAGVGNQGFSVPIRGPNGQFAMFTVSDRSGDARWRNFTAEHVADLILIAHFINLKALEIERGTDYRALHSLSPREVDALTKLAMGLNRAQAADSLAISEHTLRAYVESARFKLGAANTTQAVARAIAEGFVLI
ncbi:helix-turn-helix transcriptional regulator [Defluviimonas salinarum]|uniref:LuxR family transcriptional regulator n=1 Tax=Defluviimonas salinarum TaxID=2992147 RepID=A0ABT3J8G0_9RHOB|nr:LuxR family transcriptional regulator [Defluviimonas salinarum]MCW3783978.1 LuxR family transcriptional regulator [Defluviimonas salinarum]